MWPGPLLSLVRRRLPLSSSSPGPRSYFSHPIVTLHSWVCSTFSLISHGLVRWILPTLSSSSLWCDTARQHRERKKAELWGFTVLRNPPLPPPLPHHHSDPLICALPISLYLIFSSYVFKLLLSYIPLIISSHFPFVVLFTSLCYSHLCTVQFNKHPLVISLFDLLIVPSSAFFSFPFLCPTV